MNPSTSEHWRSQAAPPPADGQRPFGGLFSTNGASQQTHVLPPPPSSYPSHHSQQSPSQHQPAPSTSHSLSIADLTQGPPSHSQYNTQPPPAHTQSHQMSGLTGTLPHQSPDYLGREREIREIREIRAREEMRERERSREQLLHERDARDRQLREQQAPHQSHAGSIPIHQPVASKVQGALQGPNGLLGSGGVSAAQQAAVPVAASQSGLFGLPTDQRPPFAHQPPVQPQAQPQPFMSGPSPMSSQAQLAHGQQPILNDALSYLDQVKVRFSDQPDVYNRFLDIMKDFKSQAIDTPGVINRVSELFNGHPTLIQGFNTFLPPGYRIECGTDENPDAIRVTTPSGTMTQSLQPRGRNTFDAGPPAAQSLGRQEPIDINRSWPPPVSPSSRAARLPGYDQSQDRYEQDSSMQQDQRNVSQLQNAASAAANGRQGPTSSPTPGQAGLFPAQGGVFGAGADLKRGGPVEFNHAISYVNKIKNRFAQQPEIYKQFLEILQTYQRESKPIQDVYSQVTQLFLTAPDLLEDFKQFLPESAAHAKAQANARAQQAEAELSALRGEPSFGPLPQAHTPRPTAKMPPMGQFDPPSTSKETKKRKVPAAGLTQTQAHTISDARARTTTEVAPVHANKRQKLDNKPKVEVAVAPAVDPTLVPALPEPLPPAPTASATQEELGFFDRAKKQIGNRASYAEFLKLMNLYTQDLIDKYILADRVQAFIGSNPDLMSFFKSFLGIEEHDEVIEARTRPDPGRVNLAHCRAFGPSYRHLPKRDQNKTCKGRDGMCYEVLNDVWASHPTWASEDSGFVAHRKNQYEEALHRIEEERHDYDFHIETCQRTIQLMDPLVQQIGVMNDQERQTFRVDRGLGGASEAIPKRIILKVYGREIGNKVLNDMYERPAQVLPIVLQRLKQKLEEWKQVQREWEKVWRDQTQKQFWKSLDHQGINTKNIDKKNFQQKTLTSEIQAKYEEQKRSRDHGLRSRKHQLEYSFKDKEVLAEATELILVGLDNIKSELNGGQQARVKLWLQDFVVKFFGLDRDKFIEQVETALQQFTMPTEDVDDGNESEAQASGSKKPLHKSGDWLRRAALERRNGKEDSAAPTSKESTPAPEAMSETSMDVDAPQPVEEKVEKKWIRLQKKDSPAKEVSMDAPYDHTSFNFYANATIYCFFRLFEMLYSRLLAIKQNEETVEEAINRWKGESAGILRKPALSLNMIDKTPDKFFKDVSGERDFYSQILEMCAEVIVGRLDLSHLEDTLRRYYNKSGWQLYTVDKLVAAITRFILNILGGDVKDKSLDITNLFFKDREREQTTRKQELQYRKQVEKMSKDGEVFRITWTPNDQLCTIKLFPPDDSTFDSNELTDEARWQYYVASYSMTDPTEGIDHSRVKRTLLQRNIQPQNPDVAKAYTATYANLIQEDEQEAFIDLDTYKMHHKGYLSFERVGNKLRKRYGPGKIEESEPFKEKFIRNVAWMKDQRAEDVEARKTLYEKGVREGLADFEEQFGK